MRGRPYILTLFRLLTAGLDLLSFPLDCTLAGTSAGFGSACRIGVVDGRVMCGGLPLPSFSLAQVRGRLEVFLK